MCIHTYLYMYMHMYTHIYIYSYVYLYSCVRANHSCVCVLLYVCPVGHIYIRTHIHSEPNQSHASNHTLDKHEYVLPCTHTDVALERGPREGSYTRFVTHMSNVTILHSSWLICTDKCVALQWGPCEGFYTYFVTHTQNVTVYIILEYIHRHMRAPLVGTMWGLIYILCDSYIERDCLHNYWLMCTDIRVKLEWRRKQAHPRARVCMW